MKETLSHAFALRLLTSHKSLCDLRSRRATFTPLATTPATLFDQIDFPVCFLYLNVKKTELLRQGVDAFLPIDDRNRRFNFYFSVSRAIGLLICDVDDFFVGVNRKLQGVFLRDKFRESLTVDDGLAIGEVDFGDKNA